MVVQLQRGQRFDLTGAQPGLQKLSIDLEYSGGQAWANLFAFLLNEQDSVPDRAHFVCYAEPRRNAQSVAFISGGKTADGMGEHLRANLPRIPESIQRIVFVLARRPDASTHPGEASVQFHDEQNGSLLARLDVEQSFQSILEIGELYHHKQNWKFRVFAEALNLDLAAICRRHGLADDAVPREHQPKPKVATVARQAPKAAVPAPLRIPKSVAPLRGSGPRSLKKGERLDLEDQGQLVVDISWQGSKDKAGCDFDVRAGALLLGENQLVDSPDDLDYRGNRHSGAGAVSLEIESMRQRFRIKTAQIPADVAKVTFIMALNKGFERRQEFGRVRGLMVRIGGEDTAPMAGFPIDDMFGDEFSGVLGELYRHKDIWKFQLVGSGFAGDLAALCSHFGLKTVKAPVKTKMAFQRVGESQGDDELQFIARVNVDEVREVLMEHIRFHGGASDLGVFHFRNPIRLDIYIVEPTPDRNYFTLVTHGMSDSGQSGRGSELILCLPPDWPMTEAALRQSQTSWPIDLLREVAARTVQGGQPLFSGTIITGRQKHKPYGGKFPAVLVYLPIQCAEFEDLAINDKTSINFLSLIPIYRDEQALASQKSPDQLAEILMTAGITELLSTSRKSAIKKEEAPTPRKTNWFGRNR